MKDKYIYAVRNVTTGKLQQARCDGGGKFYQIEGFAKSRCNEYNKRGYGTDYTKGEFKVVKFRLIEEEDYSAE